LRWHLPDFPSGGQGEKQVGGGHELGQRQPIGELDDDNQNREKEGHPTENSGEDDDEIEEGDHLQKDHREGGRELQDA